MLIYSLFKGKTGIKLVTPFSDYPVNQTKNISNVVHMYGIYHEFITTELFKKFSIKNNK